MGFCCKFNVIQTNPSTQLPFLALEAYQTNIMPSVAPLFLRAGKTKKYSSFKERFVDCDKAKIFWVAENEYLGHVNTFKHPRLVIVKEPIIKKRCKWLRKVDGRRFLTNNPVESLR